MNTLAIRRQGAPTDRPDIPAAWRAFLRVIKVGKAGVTGAGLGLAMSGLVNIAAATLSLAALRHENSFTLEIFAAVGATIGAAGSIIAAVKK